MKNLIYILIFLSFLSCKNSKETDFAVVKNVQYDSIIESELVYDEYETEQINYKEQDTIIEEFYSLGKIRDTEFLYSISYYEQPYIQRGITFYKKHKDIRTELETIATGGAYVGDIELFIIDNNYFINAEMSETSGVSYSYFYVVDTKNMTLNKVEEDYGNFKLPDSLEIHKGFGISREKDNRFISGSRLRSKNTGEYYLEKEYKMTKENGKFVLKCISTEIYSDSY